MSGCPDTIVFTLFHVAVAGCHSFKRRLNGRVHMSVVGQNRGPLSVVTGKCRLMIKKQVN